MTHLILLAEGYPDGFKHFERDMRALKYKITEGSEGEVSTPSNTRWVNPVVREFRLYDIVIKDHVKDQFLADIKEQLPFNLQEIEKDGKGILHGVDGTGFKVGVFRRMLQTALSMINCKPISFEGIKPTNQLRDVRVKNNSVWHGHYMLLGELPDGFVKEGRLKGREQT